MCRRARLAPELLVGDSERPGRSQLGPAGSRIREDPDSRPVPAVARLPSLRPTAALLSWQSGTRHRPARSSLELSRRSPLARRTRGAGGAPSRVPAPGVRRPELASILPPSSGPINPQTALGGPEPQGAAALPRANQASAQAPLGTRGLPWIPRPRLSTLPGSHPTRQLRRPARAPRALSSRQREPSPAGIE